MAKIAVPLLKLIGRAVSFLPRSVQLALGRGLGQVAWLVTPQWRKKMAIDNAQFALQATRARAEAAVKASVVRFGPMILEVLGFTSLTKEKMERIVKWEGREHIDAAVAEGKGVVMATAHFGNWEILAAAMGLSGYQSVAVGRKQNNPDMDRLIRELRNAVGVHVTYKTGVLEMARMLGQGHVVGLLMDQDAGTDGLATHFFNKPSYVPQGPAALARLKQAPIVPCVIIDQADGTYVMKCWPVLHVARSSDKEQDIRQMTERLVRWLEEVISDRPDLWFWLHNRWKTQPPGM